MMRYNKNSHNFMPYQEKKSEITDYDLVLKKNRTLVKENRILQDKLENLKTHLAESEGVIADNNEKVLMYSKEISFLESQLEKNKSSSNKNENENSDQEVDRLKKVNGMQKTEIESYKEHISTLYLILLVSVVMQDST